MKVASRFGIVLALMGAAFLVGQERARGQVQGAAGGGITQVVVLDNERFNVRRLTFPAGYRQQLHTVAANRDEIVIQITPGEFEARVDDKVASGVQKPGTLWAVPKAPSQHAFANTSKQPIDVLVVQVK
jgi:hypothetical protein